MGYLLVMGECIGCRRIMHFHPHRVPSIRINGVRQPICQACVDRVNPKRIANGLEPIHVLPGAYDVAEESELIDDED